MKSLNLTRFDTRARKRAHLCAAGKDDGLMAGTGGKAERAQRVRRLVLEPDQHLVQAFVAALVEKPPEIRTAKDMIICAN
jgi:hypothetical protein